MLRVKAMNTNCSSIAYYKSSCEMISTGNWLSMSISDWLGAITSRVLVLRAQVARFRVCAHFWVVLSTVFEDRFCSLLRDKYEANARKQMNKWVISVRRGRSRKRLFNRRKTKHPRQVASLWISHIASGNCLLWYSFVYHYFKAGFVGYTPTNSPN